MKRHIGNLKLINQVCGMLSDLGFEDIDIGKMFEKK